MDIEMDDAAFGAIRLLEPDDLSALRLQAQALDGEPGYLLSQRKPKAQAAAQTQQECSFRHYGVGLAAACGQFCPKALRSAWDLIEYEVWATDGEIGALEGLIVDETSWHLGYLDVKAGDWLQGRSVLIPTRWVKSISWADLRINLHHNRDGI